LLLLVLFCAPALGAARDRDVVATGEGDAEPTALSLVKSDGRRIDAPARDKAMADAPLWARELFD
jgi:hypothetical protein